MFKENLQNIISDLSKHKRDRAKLLESYIQLRLNASLRIYYEELMDSYHSLLYKKELKVIKKINKDN